MGFLLDTNVLSDLVRHPLGQTAKRIEAVGVTSVCTSIIVAAELKFGVEKRASRRLRRKVDDVLGAIDVLPFSAPADTMYAQLRNQLEATGKPIGGNDLLIAAHALALGHTLVTANLREFARVDGLACENWLS